MSSIKPEEWWEHSPQRSIDRPNSMGRKIERLNWARSDHVAPARPHHIRDGGLFKICHSHECTLNFFFLTSVTAKKFQQVDAARGSTVNNVGGD
jgi:hypothetical protein